jgi:ABC-type nitrate/sulfonate/bicarbonate transport system permease component
MASLVVEGSKKGSALVYANDRFEFKQKLIRYTRKQLIFLLLIVWQVLCSLKVFPQINVPSPLDVGAALIDLIKVGLPPGYKLGGHILGSLVRVAWGFFFALIIGFPLGILMGWSGGLREAIRPIVEVFRPIPPLAWIPIAIIWFGIGIKSAAFIIFLGAFFPILLDTISGVLMINPILIDVSRTLRVSQRGILIHVITFGALPSVFTGIRVGLGVAWMTLVAAEFTGVKTGYGLGYMIMTGRDVQRPDYVVAGMIIIGLVGYAMDVVIRTIRAKTLRWAQEQ